MPYRCEDNSDIVHERIRTKHNTIQY